MPDMLSNTSCLIALDNIGQLTLLHELYGTIHISEEVAAEFGGPVPAWITIHSVQDKTKCIIWLIWVKPALSLWPINSRM